jgi:hypothetical protein
MVSRVLRKQRISGGGGKGIMRTPSWKYCSSIYRRNDHCTLYRDSALGAQLQVMIKLHWSLLPRRERSYYFIDGVDRVFTSEADLVQALARREVRKRILRFSIARKDRPGGIARRVAGPTGVQETERAEGAPPVRLTAGGSKSNR